MEIGDNMRTEEEIKEKIKNMEEGLIQYKEIYDKCFLNTGKSTGIPTMVEESSVYITIKNQIDALYWVLGEKPRKGL